ncbi:hypothetical protein HPB51_006953 [Rhipicephalus microplus]|uniref:Uncharacterized protein n=1 Tax=Rhipicephalus microplus TaxID=6941 RepID=A0A9J6DTQ3_RHIMP|nr:hypothetical protein HPB51_006953 [Rhipicephalus microplus]
MDARSVTFVTRKLHESNHAGSNFRGALERHHTSRRRMTELLIFAKTFPVRKGLGELVATNTAYDTKGGPDASKFKLEISGKAAPYDVTLSPATPTDKFFAAYVGLYAEDKPVPTGLSAPAPAKAEKCTDGKVEEMVASTNSTTGLTEFKVTFTPDPDFAKDADKTIIANVHDAAKRTVSSLNLSMWKATDTLPTAFMVPALVTLLIIFALRQFPVYPYAFITMY